MQMISTDSIVVHCAAALNRIIANDPFDQQLEAVLSPALGPLLSAIGRTPAISNAIASALNDNSAAVSRPAPSQSPLQACTLMMLATQSPAAG